MKVYITMTGLSHWAVFNSLWAAIKLRHYIPDRIYIFTIKNRNKQAELSKMRFSALLSEYQKKAQIRIIEVAEADFIGTAKKISDIVKKEKSQKNTVAIEVTPGRKAMVAGALFSTIPDKVDHVFYLYLKDFDYAKNLFLHIPLNFQHSLDFVEEINNAGK